MKDKRIKKDRKQKLTDIDHSLRQIFFLYFDLIFFFLDGEKTGVAVLGRG